MLNLLEKGVGRDSDQSPKFRDRNKTVLEFLFLYVNLLVQIYNIE